jgi:hypothetical protein
MTNEFFDNDDDLFSETSSQSSSIPLAPDVDTFLEQTKDYIDSKGINSGRFAIRTGMITAFYEMSNRFIFDTDALSRSMAASLNRLTNNGFQKELYADVLEESILKRFAIKEFLEAMLSEDTAKNIKLASQKLKLDLDETYIRSYFGSMDKIMTHSIERNIKIYEALCPEINRVPMKSIIDRDYASVDISLFHTGNYIANSFNSIKESLGFNTY